MRAAPTCTARGATRRIIIRFFAGSEPQRVWAAGGTLTHPGHACIDQCVASIQFANGHVGGWIQGDAALPQFVSKFFMQLFGDGKSVQLYDRLQKAHVLRRRQDVDRGARR